MNLWVERYEALAADPQIKYVFIFENRGDVVGVTMPHPHGQIYGYPFLPKKLELEVENARAYQQEKGRCLFCRHAGRGGEVRRAGVFRTEHFTVFLPFFSEYPYGVYIMSNAHRSNIAQFTPEEREDLAEVLRRTTGMLDSLFGFKFPYMMCMYNEPVNGEDVSALFHFHIAFYPPMRSADKIKYNASSETGAWAHATPPARRRPCQRAARRLRAVHEPVKKEPPPVWRAIQAKARRPFWLPRFWFISLFPPC